MDDKFVVNHQQVMPNNKIIYSLQPLKPSAHARMFNGRLIRQPATRLALKCTRQAMTTPQLDAASAPGAPGQCALSSGSGLDQSAARG